MKNNKNMIESVKVFFPFEIYRDEDLVENALLPKEFCQEELESIAEIFENHGGYAVEMCELEGLEEELFENIYTEELERLFPDEEDYSCFDVYLCEDIPAELIAAVDQYVKFKNVDQDFYLEVDGAEIKKSFLLQVSNDTFCKMKQTVLSGPYDKSDYAQLKEEEPEAYHEVAELVFEWAYKYCVRVFGESKPCVLKNFPFQVYENL